MHIRKKTHGHKLDGTLPLINIVFLLVLAFMMAGTIAAPLPSDFDPLRSEAGKQADAGPTLETLTVNRSGLFSREGREISVSDVDLLFGEISISKSDLEFRVDARAPANAVIALLGSAERAGIKDVQIITLSSD